MAPRDFKIPAPRAWDTATAHDGMDDMGEASEALFSRRITVGELDAAALNVVHAALAPAEACTELGADEPRRRRRMGELKSWERRMLHAKSLCWSVLGLGFMAVVLWATKP